MQRLVILANNALKARALASSWEQACACVVLGHATDLAGAIRLIRDVKPTLIVLDPDAPLWRTDHALALLRRQHPRPRLHLGMPSEE